MPGEEFCGLDVNLARQVQQLLLPKGSPFCSWCCIGVKNRMALGLGGDYFDFIALPDGRQALFVGDVTGHGLHASVVMSLLYGFIHRAFPEAGSPREMVCQANDFLQSFATRSREYDHFFSSTLFCGVIDPQSLEMQYVNAGHPPPLVKRAGELSWLEPTTTPIGFFDDPEIGQESFSFLEGDRLLLYTDGITEAANEKGDLFGAERLSRIMRQGQEDHLHFLEDLFEGLRRFGAKDPPRDDCTGIVFDFHPWRPGVTPREGQ